MDLATSFSAARTMLLKESANESVVSVFWDYESCPSPSKHSQSACLEAIRAIAMSYGSVRAFNLYIDISRHPELGQTTVIREHLHDSGISVLDCPVGDKTIADKMMIVDLFGFAIRNSAPGTLMVISTDPDLSYTLSLLRQRRFTVVLVTSDKTGSNSTSTLKPQTDTFLSWSSSPLRDLLEPSSISAVPNTSAAPTPSLAPQPVVSTLSARPLPAPGAPVAATTVPSKSAFQVLPLSTSSLASSSKTRAVTRPVTLVMPSNTQAQKRQTQPTVPEHLKVLVKVISQAKRTRGWEVEYIDGLLRGRQETRQWQEGMSTVYLAEAVRLGILVRSTVVSKKDKKERFFFAVKKRTKFGRSRESVV